MSHNLFLLHKSETAHPNEGPSPFDLPPVAWQDGDHRSFLVRELETNPYNGVKRHVHWVKAPDPEPQKVVLAKGVRFGELILDLSTFLVAVSEEFDGALGGLVSGALQECEPVALFRAGLKRSRAYRMGTLAPRDAIATHVDFAGSVFDLVDPYAFPRHGIAVESGDIAPGTSYPVVESDCTFADLEAYKVASRENGNALRGDYVPTRLKLRGDLPSVLHLDHGCVLVSSVIAKALNAASEPGAICPYPAVRLEMV